MQIAFTNIPAVLRTSIIPVNENAGVVKGDPVDTVLQSYKEFTGKIGQTVVLRNADGQRTILVGFGKKADLDQQSIAKVAPSLWRVLAAEGVEAGYLDFAHIGITDAELPASFAAALLLESYEFKKYKTNAQPTAFDLGIITKNPAAAEAAYAPLRASVESVFWASDLANEPGNVLNPATYADKIKAELGSLPNVKITVLDSNDMKKLGMGAALAVGQGSATPPCMVVIEYDGSNGAQSQPLALVGKGITFDTGGISLKPGAGMGDMTLDMGGSAAVVGTMRALAQTGSTEHVVAIVGLAENMPDGNAYRPGDIVKSMNGKTIYIGNTDAEGRLVLADALTYIQRIYNPHTVVDLATLTGAAVAAFGKNIAPVYSNDNSLSAKFNAASAATDEKTWPMPLMETDEFTKAVRNTPLADLTNLATGPGSCTAAAFLHEFIEKDDDGKDKCAWMHIDMAGPGIPETIRKGWGVRLLTNAVSNQGLASTKKKAAPGQQP